MSSLSLLQTLTTHATKAGHTHTHQIRFQKDRKQKTTFLNLDSTSFRKLNTQKSPQTKKRIASKKYLNIRVQGRTTAALPSPPPPRPAPRAP